MGVERSEAAFTHDSQIYKGSQKHSCCSRFQSLMIYKGRSNLHVVLLSCVYLLITRRIDDSLDAGQLFQRLLGVVKLSTATDGRRSRA